MELVKNIFFNTDKLIANSTIKISYAGRFFEDHSESVTLHYGFDSDWKEPHDIPMTKTELGFQAEVELKEMSTFNFCLKNEHNEWDNNNGENYVFKIEAPELGLVIVEDNYSVRTADIIKTWSTKVKDAIVKMFTFVPKIVTGNYKKKSDNSN